MSSIRYRTIVFLIGSLLVINMLSGYYIYQHTQEEIEEIFNAEQAQVARIIDQLITDTAVFDAKETSITQVPNIQGNNTSQLGHHYEQKIAYQVWDLDGNLLLMSENAPLYPLSATVPGFSQIQYGDKAWHIFALYSNTAKKWIYTAQNHEARDELIELITRDQIRSMLLVNFLVLVVVVIGVIAGTQPILVLSRELSTRDGSNLNSIDIVLSKELHPIQQSINHLLKRINITLHQEKSFNADLSHELRTPLAAIKIHAQNIELKETLSKEGQRSLTRMISGVDIMSKTIEQLLLLSNIESQKHTHMHEEVGLLDLAKATFTLLPSQMHQRNDIELEGDNVFVQGNRVLLGVLVRNLIENASKYSDENTPITVTIKQEHTSAIIDVADRGPGMTDTQKTNAIQRRYRVSDTQHYGSGLGLSIAHKIVELHHGKLRFTDQKSGSGLVASVQLFLKLHSTEQK